jgi:hypothetical protein
MNCDSYEQLTRAENGNRDQKSKLGRNFPSGVNRAQK